MQYTRTVSTRRRDVLRIGLGGGLGLLLAACATSAPSQPTQQVPPTPQPQAPAQQAPAQPANKPSLQKARILYNVPLDPTFVPDLTAYRRLGDQYGIPADVQEITGADASIKALIAGQAEFALSTLASGLLAVGQKQTIKAAIPAASAPYFTLVVTSDITDWPALAGKRIGITATSDSSYFTTLLQLQQHGVDPNAIDWVTVRGVPARVDALRAGKIDASQVTVGAALDLLQDPKYRRFAEVGKDFPNLLFSAYWVTEAMIRDHPDVVQAFAEALMQEHRSVQDKTRYLAAARPLFANSLDEPTLSASYDLLKSMNIWDPNEARWNGEAGSFTSKTLADSGATEQDLPWTQWATTQFVDAARQKLGPFTAA
jgi:ABC-type nitrate/sulfonate/bicarbonate transport system substrate-binding protein